MSSLKNQSDFKIEKIGSHTVKTIKIGNQIWMAENLNVSHYRNGDPIPQVQDEEEWQKLETGAWCHYGNDPEYDKIYGKLYNCYAVNDPRGLAPKGWHVPTDKEWQKLEMYLGMSRLEADNQGWRGAEGNKMKEGGHSHWDRYNIEATNASGFTALAGGYRHGEGSFCNIGEVAYFWSSTESSPNYAWNRRLNSGDSEISRYPVNMRGGFSVRCIKD